MAAKETHHECKAFELQIADLADSLVAHQIITPFANRLLSEGLIDKKVLINIQDERNPPYERANKILNPLLPSLENPKKATETFVAIVKSLKKVGLRDIATELIKTLETKGGQVPQELIESEDTQPTGISENVIVPEPVADDEVMKDANTKPDMKELLNIIATELGQTWEQFGLKLGFQKGELDTIAANNNYMPLECCRELFDSWEAKADKNHPFLWSTVLTSLKAPNVGLRSMAVQMEEKRKTLKIYIASYNEEFKDLSYRTELDELMEKVGYRVPSKWKPIASELGLSRGIIGSISCTGRSDMNRIMKVFDEWKRQIPKPDNWQVLLVALCMPQVGEKQIALDVAKELRENK